LISKEDEIGRAFKTHGRQDGCIQGFGEKTGGKRSLDTPRYRWEDNSKTDFRKVLWSGMEWIDLAQDRDQWRALVNTAMSLRVP
jgi:hypothetical protein